jgi:hypothetical protein
VHPQLQQNPCWPASLGLSLQLCIHLCLQLKVKGLIPLVIALALPLDLSLKLLIYIQPLGCQQLRATICTVDVHAIAGLGASQGGQRGVAVRRAAVGARYYRYPRNDS